MVLPQSKIRLTCFCGRRFSVVNVASQPHVDCPLCGQRITLPTVKAPAPLAIAEQPPSPPATQHLPPHSEAVPDIMALNLAELSAISLDPPEDLQDRANTVTAAELAELSDPHLNTLPLPLQLVFREMLTQQLLGRQNSLRQLQRTLSLHMFELQDRLERLSSRGLIRFLRGAPEQLQLIPPEERPPEPIGPAAQTAPAALPPPQPPQPLLAPPTAARFPAVPTVCIPPAAPPDAAVRSVPPWIEQLLASPRFQQQRAKAGRTVPGTPEFAQILQAIDERGGRTTATALSRMTCIPMHRLRGRFAMFQRVLNVDGICVFRSDDETDTVEIDRHLLRSQFALSD
jgi:hypothetical protein